MLARHQNDEQDFPESTPRREFFFGRRQVDRERPLQGQGIPTARTEPDANGAALRILSPRSTQPTALAKSRQSCFVSIQ
jgi:hypothetical protein